MATKHKGAFAVGAGILLSRLAGLLRQKLLAHFLGVGPVAAAFVAAMRIPNFLQNLFGEGALSAAFIPVYARLRAQKQDEEADKLAFGLFSVLLLLVSILVVLGIEFAEVLAILFTPGFEGEQRVLTVELTRILFPGTGILVLSAWCLGILNSHRQFFLSYAAPVVWNGCIIAALLLGGEGMELLTLARWTCWGVLAGSVAQFLIQWPFVWRHIGGPKWEKVRMRGAPLKEVLKNALPAIGARGVGQTNALIDSAVSSMVGERAVAALANAQVFSLLPLSLFGVAVSAAELPALSEDADKQGAREALRERLQGGLERMALFVIPSVVGLFALGDCIASIFESGRVTAADTRYIGYMLTASSLGLWAQTRARLYTSAFFALKDTRTPFGVSMLRLAVSACVGFLAALYAARWLGLPAHMGAIGLCLTSSLVAWLEYIVLRKRLALRIGAVEVGRGARFAGQWKLWCAALCAALMTLATKYGLVLKFGAVKGVAEEYGGGWLAPPELPYAWWLSWLLLFYGGIYFLIAVLLGDIQARGWLVRFGKRMRVR
ncbi:MAG: murein biosynthesis integral membrane protein MurJ [Proteobacteria bacterium]|nr:murein biosynthesis integral membrane protein MurJ [Cystobacterineae bacterium]MCL2259113.1 murein biosynthesis integral membrane protein MurJ [Cystobacterineae bacterium]MCL2314515.1 murein biosynthesis integral membrane protein MurJ [Pseudomonadota bacterium]